MSRAPQKNIPAKSQNKFQSLSQDELQEIEQAFQLFDTNNTGRINPTELKQAMQSLGFDNRNPTIYEMICELDSPEAQRQGGIDLNQFVDAINNKLGDKETEEGCRRIFQLFVSDPDSQTITANDLRRIAKELGENISKEELDDMLKRASSSGHDLTFQEFFQIMTKKTFP